MKGFAVLPMALMFSFIVAVAAAAIAFLGVSEITQSGKGREAGMAFFVAQAGAEDARIRIVRDASYATTTATLAVGNGTSTIIVQKDTFSSPCTATSATGKSCIVSTGDVKGAKRRIEMVVSRAALGKITVDSIKEIAP